MAVCKYVYGTAKRAAQCPTSFQLVEASGCGLLTKPSTSWKLVGHFPQEEKIVNESLRVVIADDERPARSFLAAMLRGFEDVTLVGEAEDGAEAVEVIERT